MGRTVPEIEADIAASEDTARRALHLSGLVAQTEEPYVYLMQRFAPSQEIPRSYADFLTSGDAVEEAVAHYANVLAEALTENGSQVRWTSSLFRRADASFKATCWLLIPRAERIEYVGESRDRMRAHHACYLHLISGLFVFRGYELREERDHAQGLIQKAERDHERALFDERLRIQEEAVRAVEARRQEQARRDAEWDSAQPGAAA
jgi:hypothetical protein